MTADEGLAEEVMAGTRGRKPLALEEAKAFLRSALGAGARPAKDVLAEWRETTGEGRRTLDRARGTLEIMVFRPQNPGPWYWSLPKGGHETDFGHGATQGGADCQKPDCHNAEHRNFGNLAICDQKRSFDTLSKPDCQNSPLGNLPLTGNHSVNEHAPTTPNSGNPSVGMITSERWASPNTIPTEGGGAGSAADGSTERIELWLSCKFLHVTWKITAGGWWSLIEAAPGTSTGHDWELLRTDKRRLGGWLLLQELAKAGYRLRLEPGEGDTGYSTIPTGGQVQPVDFPASFAFYATCHDAAVRLLREVDAIMEIGWEEEERTLPPPESFTPTPNRPPFGQS